MNIMIVHHFGKIGGGTNSCFDICRMLRENGHNVTVVIPSPTETVKNTVLKIGVRLVSAPVGVVRLSCHNADSGTLKEVIKYFLSVKNSVYWKRLFQNEKPDLVMFNSSVLGPLVKLAHKLELKTLCFIRETARENGSSVWKHIHRKLLSKADGLVFLTEYDVASWKIHNKGQQVVIPDIVDEQRLNIHAPLRNDLPWDNRRKYLLYLGGFSAAKGMLDLLNAFSVCTKKDSRLTLIILGDTSGKVFMQLRGVQRFLRKKSREYYEKCRTEVTAINQKSNSIMNIGLVSDVSQWYRKADIVIFPVKKVHQARPVYEAGLFQKPVIVPEYENFQDSVIDGYNGLVYKKNNIMDMADKILALTSDETACQKMGKNNYALYCKNHTYEEAKRRLSELLSSLQ